jgi:hypothetical protein
MSEWQPIPADVVLAAVFDALSWMDPETAARWRAEVSYKRLEPYLRNDSSRPIRG